MDNNVNEEKTLNIVNSFTQGVWRGDSRSCEKGQIICPGSKLTQPVNMNELKNQSVLQQPIKTGDTTNTTDQQPISSPVTIPTDSKNIPEAGVVDNEKVIENVNNDNKGISPNILNQSNKTSPAGNQSNIVHQPIRFNLTNNQPIRLSTSSSSDSSDSSKTTTWGQVKSTSPKKSKNHSKQSQSQSSSNTPNCSPTKGNKNERVLTSWKNVSPTKSTSSSDLENSKHSEHSNEYNNRIFRFSTSRLKDLSDSGSSSSTDLDAEVKGSKGHGKVVVSNPTTSDSDSTQTPEQSTTVTGVVVAVTTTQVALTNHGKDQKCGCSVAGGKGSPCKKRPGSCNCSNNCTSHSANQNTMVNSNSSLNENDNSGSPKREKGSPDEVCDNEYFYEDDFSVQFDTNLRETSVTPSDSDPSTTILDFPNMVTGSYLRFNGGSSNVSFNNSKASSNVSLNNLRVSNIINNEEHRHYDSENSGNSGSHNSTMEMSSSDTGRDMMNSSDMIELSDGPLFTPTPAQILSTDSLDKHGHNADPDMAGSNGSGSETNLNVDCCPRKEEYFLSFDGSHSKVSGSETDISLSFTSHDSSCPGHWVHGDASGTSHDSAHCCQGQHGHSHGHDASNEFSSSEGQEESTDSFHVCFNKLSPRHKGGNQYAGRENLTGGRVLKRLVTVKENPPEGLVDSNSSEDGDGNMTRTSTTLTAGSKDPSSASNTLQTSPKKRALKPIREPVGKMKSRGGKSEQLYLVGFGKPVEIMRKAAVHSHSHLTGHAGQGHSSRHGKGHGEGHSHSLPRVKQLVSWKQLRSHSTGSGYAKCQSLPELSTSTSWQNISAMKCRKLSEISESFHNKRHSASLLEFYQRMKSQSNPVSPETMNNLEHILWPNFIGQKGKSLEMSETESSGSSQGCPHCQCQQQHNGLPDSGTKGYKNKRIFDWLKMDCSASSKDSNQRPNSLACQTGLVPECFTKETLISPKTVTLWEGTKTVGSQFPPSTKDCSMQTILDQQNAKETGKFVGIGKKDQALQTSDFEEEEILSILSDNFEDYGFLKSNEGIAKDLISCPDFVYVEGASKGGKSDKIQRSKSADGYGGHRNRSDITSSNKSYQGVSSRKTGHGSQHVGRSKSAGRLSDKSLAGRRMGLSRYYSHQSLPDIAFLVSSVSLEKDESKDSLFDAMKLDLPVPVTIAPKTELEQFNIYKQKSTPCHHHRPRSCVVKSSIKGETDIGSSSSGISTSSASSGIDPGYCDCRSRSTESPENDLERLIFFPPHTEEKIKSAKDCCNAKRRAKSLPSRLSECANRSSSISNSADPKLNKYANEVRPPVSVSGSKGQGQCRISQKWISGGGGGGKTTQDTEQAATTTDNLYSLKEENTPLASPEQPCCHRDCYGDGGCQVNNKNKCNYIHGEQDITESDFYRAVESDKIILVGNGYHGFSMGLDSNSSSDSSVPNIDRKPLKSCLRKRGQGQTLRSTRSMSAADTMALNFDDLEAKVRNHRHSYGCDEVYIVSDEHGQLMMYQADESAEPVMFYLGKDGECHMTEGNRNHLENFGSLANFNIQACDSIHGSDTSSTDREGSSKRKSVSFASEVSFQSISPAASPRKPGHASGSSSEGESEAADNKQEVTSQEVPAGKEGGSPQEKCDDQKTTGDDIIQSNVSVLTSDSDMLPGNSSSSDSAPEEFHVASDTNDNLWFEDVMLEKIGLLESVSKSSDVLVAHFATSNDTFEKLRLGNTVETPVLGDIVITRLCTALTAVLGDGLKHHLAGFQMFGSVQVTVWKVVEASVEIVPQTRSLCDLVQKVKQTSYLTTHQQKFDAFVFGLLNLRVLDFWMGYLRQKEAQLSKFYNSGAILVHSNTALKKHYDDVITSIQHLAVLPFHLDTTFIRDKALTDSKFKSEEMIGSAEGMIKIAANQRGVLDSPANENGGKLGGVASATARSSVLDFSASKALNWLANAALPKRQSSSEGQGQMTGSRSSTFDSVTPSSPTNQMTGSASFPGMQTSPKSETTVPKVANKSQFSESRKLTYSDAKNSTIDIDPIISPSESMRSSQNSQTGFSSLFSTMAARLGESSANQSLTASMTSSASSLVTRLTGIKLGQSQTPQTQKTYKKGVTEYKFEDNERQTVVNEDVGNKDTVTVAEKDTFEKSEKVETQSVTAPVKMREKKNQSGGSGSEGGNRNSASKRVSFDIVNLFDKLLLPAATSSTATTKPAEKKEVVKPVSKIPVPKNTVPKNTRWSWNFSMPKLTGAGTTTPSRVIPKASTDTDIYKGKVTGAVTPSSSQALRNQSSGKAKNGGKIETSSASHKNEHFPKRGGGIYVSKETEGDVVKPAAATPRKGGNSKLSHRSPRVAVPAPPKPPRLVQSIPTSGRKGGEEIARKNTSTL